LDVTEQSLDNSIKKRISKCSSKAQKHPKDPIRSFFTIFIERDL